MFIPSNNNTMMQQDNTEIIKRTNSFYKRFNTLQAKNELSDYQLSKLTGISESRIERLGIGKTLPTFEELIILKSNFNVSLDWLLFGESSSPQLQAQNWGLTCEEIEILKKMALNQSSH